jgi:hypothetical protein
VNVAAPSAASVDASPGSARRMVTEGLMFVIDAFYERACWDSHQSSAELIRVQCVRFRRAVRTAVTRITAPSLYDTSPGPARLRMNWLKDRACPKGRCSSRNRALVLSVQSYEWRVCARNAAARRSDLMKHPPNQASSSQKEANRIHCARLHLEQDPDATALRTVPGGVARNPVTSRLAKVTVRTD